VWLTSNLFFDSSLISSPDIKTVIHSLPIDIPGVPHSVNPRVYYPCSDSADFLNKKFGTDDKAISTIILGLDNVRLERSGVPGQRNALWAVRDSELDPKETGAINQSKLLDT